MPSQYSLKLHIPYHLLLISETIKNDLYNPIIIMLPPSTLPSLPSFFGPTGLVAAKKSTLIAIAKPACSTSTTMRRILLVFASVVLRTGYKFLRRKVAEKASPRATKT